MNLLIVGAYIKKSVKQIIKWRIRNMTIKIEIDIPKSCQKCDLRYQGPTGLYCCLTDSIAESWDCRRENCPLKEIKE